MNIRCSMLPGWNDYKGRAAAKQYPRLLAEHGFQVRKVQPSIGAAIGTATHKVVAALLRAKMQGTIRDGSEGGLDAAMEGALQSFREEIARGAEWDDTSPTLQIAESQIRSLARAYLPLIPETESVMVESGLKASIGNGWEVSGTLDLFTLGSRLDDLKTGVLPRPYIAQVGGYVLVLESNGFPVKESGTTFIKRVRQSKPQPAPVRRDYDPQIAKRVAFSAAHDIRETMERFADGPRKGNPYVIAKNPMSLMCSKRFCPAWGTEFCREHEPEKPEES